MPAEKRGKKGQSANEAAMIVTFMTLIFILALSAVSDDLIAASDSNYKALLQDIADVIEQEAGIAAASENGYAHPFALPSKLNGQPYILSIINSTSISDTANITILGVASKRPGIELNVTRTLSSSVRGSLVRGLNTARKEQGLVIFRPVPLTVSQQAECAATCQGIVTSEECCDQMQLCCS